MLSKNFIFLILFSCTIAVKVHGQGIEKRNLLKIEWVDKVKGDFSFSRKWSYPEGIYKNKFGQLVCDGLCPPESDDMKDSDGKIRKNRIPAYYAIIDTTHLSYTIKSDANVGEWAGTNFIEAERISADTVYAYTINNASTHSSLQLTISGNDCKAVVSLTSITGKDYAIEFTKGYILIDKRLWEKGILKASFDFKRDVFSDFNGDKIEPFYWKGKILSPIKNK